MSGKFQAPAHTLHWEHFETILLDMDGTLLDLSFDNYFWRELVPGVYAEQQDISEAEARDVIFELYAGREGTLEWYCLDFWTEHLQINLVELKHSARDRIRFLPGAKEFLQAASDRDKRLVLVTNAHQDALHIKNSVTELHRWCDELISSHDFGLPKEHQEFWQQLEEHLGFDKETTLFLDDSVPVLNAAREFGLGGVVAIRKPVEGHPPKDTEDHHAIDGVGFWGLPEIPAS